MNLPWLEAPWQAFLERAGEDRLAHALLLTGAGGSGKSRLAEAMAAWLLCLRPGHTACGECRSCRLLPGGAHPEYARVTPEEGKHVIRVDAIRDFTGNQSLTTTVSRRKVALIDPADAMNLNAANALLKNLEEPVGDTVIVLVCRDVSRLPVTIRSRCQLLTVPTPSRPESVRWLQATQGAARADCEAALDAAGDSPLWARSMLDSGQLAVFEELQQHLAQLIGRPLAAGAVAAGLADTDPAIAWHWLSRSAASAARAVLAGAVVDWLPAPDRLDARRLAELQGLADRNARLASGAVRQDLLLQDWLLEWASQARPGVGRGRTAP